MGRKTTVKRMMTVFLCAALMLALCACGGDVSNVKTHEVASEIYDKTDIESAINVIISEFGSGWDGCTLREIYYAGDEKTLAETHYYLEKIELYDADELIVLLSTFDVDSSGGDGSLNPNSTYKNWSWILVRSSGGGWKHVDHGYG